MQGVNKVILIGHLGQDPEARTLESGNMVVNFSLATSEKWKDKQGEQQQHTEWHKVTVWGKLADICARYLKKGTPVYIEGKLKTRSYEQDGVKKYSTEILASNMTMLGGNGNSQGQSVDTSAEYNQKPSAPAPSQAPPMTEGEVDDLPF